MRYSQSLVIFWTIAVIFFGAMIYIKVINKADPTSVVNVLKDFEKNANTEIP